MWILVAEALFALGLLVFIVWWTFGPAQRRERDAVALAAREAADEDGPSAGASDRSGDRR